MPKTGLTQYGGYAKLTIRKVNTIMNNTLIDRETLGQFVDELIKQKPLPVNDTEDLSNLREESIKALDEKIYNSVFGQLTEEQIDEFSLMLDSDDTSEEAYQDFFQNAGINLKETITNTMQEFATEFLGGQNA